LDKGGFEFKRRDKDERWIVPINQSLDAIKDEINKLDQEIQARFIL
jgi:hypothetical protein